MTLPSAFDEVAIPATGTGLTVGVSTTEKVAFWGVTPVVQPAGAAQEALTFTTATSNGFGFSAATSFSACLAQIEEIRASLVDCGILKGSA